MTHGHRQRTIEVVVRVKVIDSHVANAACSAEFRKTDLTMTADLPGDV